MADSRPSGLADEVLAAELATLFDSLVIPIDDPSYSPSDIKKIKAKVLLQAINDAIDTINSTLTDKANKSNVIEKDSTTVFTPSSNYHPVNVKYFKEYSETLTISTSGNWADFSSEVINGKRCGNRFHITGQAMAANASTAAQLLATISGYVSPGYNVLFTASAQNPALYESAWGFINTSGHIYLQPGKGSNQTWVFNIFVIS